MIHHKLEPKVAGINKVFENHRFLKRILPLILGLVALFWFLIRVIPKPQRATYPCMKVAYPLMSGLVIWLLGITGISASVKRENVKLYGSPAIDYNNYLKSYAHFRRLPELAAQIRALQAELDKLSQIKS